MSNALTLGFVVFFMVFTGILMTQYDRNLCPTISKYANQTIIENQSNVGISGNPISQWDYIFNLKCSNLPSWYHLLIYTPFLFVGIKSIFSTS